VLILRPTTYLVLETKGFDDLADVKAAAAERWVAAVNADGQHLAPRHGAQGQRRARRPRHRLIAHGSGVAVTSARRP
jgi:hypothetical protein